MPYNATLFRFFLPKHINTQAIDRLNKQNENSRTESVIEWNRMGGVERAEEPIWNAHTRQKANKQSEFR